MIDRKLAAIEKNRSLPKDQQFVQAESIRQLFDWIMMARRGLCRAQRAAMVLVAHQWLGLRRRNLRGPAGGTACAVRSKHGRLADSRVSRDEWSAHRALASAHALGVHLIIPQPGSGRSGR